MLQIKNQPLTSISNRLCFCAIRNTKHKQRKLQNHSSAVTFIVKKAFQCYNGVRKKVLPIIRQDLCNSLHSDDLYLLLHLIAPEL